MTIAMIKILPALWLPPKTGSVKDKYGPAANWTILKTRTGDAPFPNFHRGVAGFYFAFLQIDPMLEAQDPYRWQMEDGGYQKTRI